MKSAHHTDSAKIYVVWLSNLGRSLRMIAWIPDVRLQPDSVFAAVVFLVGLLADGEANLVVAGVAVTRHVDTFADELLGLSEELLNCTRHGRRRAVHKTSAQQEERYDHVLHTPNEKEISHRSVSWQAH